jgi:putative phosphoribosyl transferase
VSPTVGGGRFRDRADAGRRLATALAPLLATEDQPALLVGLPRGGVLVAAAAAAELHLGVEAMPVRKVGAPSNPELALGAVTAHGPPLINEQVARSEQLTQSQVSRLVAAATARVRADEETYRAGRPKLDLTGRLVVLVDDGAATGATIRACIAAARDGEASRVVVALPVAPRETLAVLSAEADDVVCLLRPLLFRAVGWAYDDFAAADTEEVLRAL